MLSPPKGPRSSPSAWHFRSGKDKTSWIQIKCCFNKMAEIAEKYLHKGAKIAISGTLVQNKWTTEDGQNRSIHQIFANQIDFIKTDGRGFENGESQPPMKKHHSKQ